MLQHAGLGKSHKHKFMAELEETHQVLKIVRPFYLTLFKLIHKIVLSGCAYFPAIINVGIANINHPFVMVLQPIYGDWGGLLYQH